MRNLRTGAKIARYLVLITALATLTPAGVRPQNPSVSDAIAFEQQGKLEDATRTWTAIAKQNPQDAAAFASLGLVLARQKKYAEAVQAYKRALALDVKLPGMQLNLGLAEFRQGHFPAAIGSFRVVLKDDPKNKQALTLLGLSYYGAKQFPQSIQYLAVAAKDEPGNIELARILAQSCLLSRKYHCALDETRRILQLNPNSVAAHVLSAEALDGLGRTPEAIAEIQTALKMSPHEPDLNFGLGYLYWRENKFNEATVAFRQELAINSQNAQAIVYLGDIAAKGNDFAGALPLLQRAIEINSDLRIAYMDIGSIFVEQKHYEQAIEQFKRAEKLDPSESDAHYRLARLYKDLGNQEASAKEFEAVRGLQKKKQEGTDLAMKMGVVSTSQIP
jgi:tetratricopeptide (TPR) repeat protein